MTNSIFKLIKSSFFSLEVPLVGLLLAAATNVNITQPLSASELQPPATSKLIKQTTASAQPERSAPRGKLPEKDGVYLYGQSPQPDQLGQEYMVFEVEQGKVVGALYLPHSEFSCFQGTLNSGKLAMVVASSPGTEPYPDPVAGQNLQQLAAVSDRSEPAAIYETSTYPHSVALQNYYQLPGVSDNDQRILATCKNN